jgi:hypothetical protein
MRQKNGNQGLGAASVFDAKLETQDPKLETDSYALYRRKS